MVFSDAVVAIAMTLLVLPLVEIPQELAHAADQLGQQGFSLGELFSGYYPEMLAFLISFVAIWNLWRAHHRFMAFFRGYDERLVFLHGAWLFTIVLLPFTTQLVISSSNNMVSVYVLALLVSALAIVAMEAHGRRHHELLDAESPAVQQWLARPLGISVVVILAVVLVVTAAFPAVGAWPLLLLFFGGAVDVLLVRLRRGSRVAS